MRRRTKKRAQSDAFFPGPPWPFPPCPHAQAAQWLKLLSNARMSSPAHRAYLEEELRIRDLEVADWFACAAIQRLREISRELAITNYELNYFEDSFRLHMAQMQQHVRRTRQRTEGPVRAALVERARTMNRISRMLERVLMRLDEQAQLIMRLSEEAQAAAPFLSSPQEG